MFPHYFALIGCFCGRTWQPELDGRGHYEVQNCLCKPVGHSDSVISVSMQFLWNQTVWNCRKVSVEARLRVCVFTEAGVLALNRPPGSLDRFIIYDVKNKSYVSHLGGVWHFILLHILLSTNCSATLCKKRSSLYFIPRGSQMSFAVFAPPSLVVVNSEIK